MIFSILLTSFLLSYPVTAQEQMVPSESPTLEKAIQAQKNENWKKAKSLYKELLKEKPRDPHLLSNFARLELARKEPMRAFALWHKALFYHPNFSAAQKGMEYLQNKGLIAEGSYEPNFLADIKRHFLQAPLFFPLLVSLIFFFLGGYHFILFLIAKKEAKELEEEVDKSPLRAGFYLAFFILFSFLAFFHYQESQKNYGISLEESALLLSPDSDSVSLYKIAPGEKVEVQLKRQDWWQVKSASEQKGWIKKEKIFPF